MSYNDDHLTQKQADPAQIVSPPPAPASLLRGVEARIDQYKRYLSTPLSQEELSQALRHEQWEVRCAALERLGMWDEPVAADLLAYVLHDENPNVRATALHILEQKRIYLPEPLPRQEQRDHSWLSFSTERKETPMSSLQPSSEIQAPANTTHPQLVGAGPRALRRKLFQGMRLVSMIAILVIVIGAVTAAGFGWWDNAFGNPNLYTEVNQQQTHQGVTIEITKVYADKGRTIIAYNTFSSDSSKQYVPDDMDITGSAPQKQATIEATYGEKGIHYYMVQPPFLVGANVNTLTITFNIGYVLVVPPVHDTTPTLTGPWHFVFTVPFHHVNNTQISDPLQ